MTTVRHPLLPQDLSPEELQKWIIKVSVERFKDTAKRYFTEEEVRDFEHESSQHGRGMNRLNAILKAVSEAVKKGTVEDMVFTVPATDGTSALDVMRRQNDDLIETGYEEIACEVFGVVDIDNELMNYFRLDGTIVDERTRPLSAKEKREFLPVRNMLASPDANRGSIGKADDGWKSVEDERTGTDN